MGKVTTNGNFAFTPGCSERVINYIKNFSNDPVGIAAAYGRRTGNCCFCARRLTDERSVTVGYGPICANKFNLPWGDTEE